MNDLVSEEAINDGIKEYFLHVEKWGVEIAVIKAINAASKYIGAASLRNAGIYICPDDNGIECRNELNRLANSLERA